ncbi:hypothetical protein C475_07120 [Halosimplex carlsbadense 2-9-1]|uniref:Uncharacterized protein n=1 Tax=Halosimplex carlsbadense 2-9-1 TaxID=797114 RepID=M0CZ16_9EURY|nr:hypothetical protein [Halosimplex carlsbadense]ELZ27672.1 hypothetical protein C475_07120 [Halosimplex carlsbadense 2-9-1]
MAMGELLRYVLRYAVAAAGAVVAVLFGAALWVEFPPQLLTMILLVPTLVGGLVLAADADHAVEAAGDSVESRFVADGPFESERALAFPGRYAVGFFLAGLGLDALVALGVLAVLS